MQELCSFNLPVIPMAYGDYKTCQNPDIVDLEPNAVLRKLAAEYRIFLF